MKKQINPAIKAHLIRGALYLLLLLAACAIPFTLAQRNATNRGVANPASMVAKFATAPPASGAAQATDLSQLRANDVPSGPDMPRMAQFPQTTSGVRAAHIIPILRAPKAPQVILYDQYNNASANATLSATFTDFATFGADLADDFVVPAGQTWNVESIDADGVYFNGSGPANSFNIFIYADNAGLPGTQIFSATDQPWVQSGTTFTVTLPTAAVLTAGTYWIEIQANMTFAVGGQWGWTDRTVQSNQGAAWKNSGGGLAACITGGRRANPAGCNIDPGIPDQVYRINGTIGGSTPTPTATPTGTPSGCIIIGSIDTTDPTHLDSLGRSGIPQTCPASTTCAIRSAPNPHHYDEYTFTNTTGATQCVTVDTNTACTGINSIFIAAYLGSFDPSNLCTNWIGDSGSSPNPDQAFSFNVNNGETFVVVVSELTPDAGCPAYTITVSPQTICEGATPTPTATATATVSVSATPTATATVHATATPTATAIATPTGTPSGCIINGRRSDALREGQRAAFLGMLADGDLVRADQHQGALLHRAIDQLRC